MSLHDIWNGLGWPLIRLTLFISLGLLVANLIEALNWTKSVARLAAPLVRTARLKDISGASFSMAFFSGVAANTMLSEAWENGELSKRELVLSNLFNSLPTYFLHLPTMFFITVPFIGKAAFVYVSLTFGAACLRTGAVILSGRLFLPPLPEGCIPCKLKEGLSKGWREALAKSWKRFKKRIPKILTITVPIYILIFFLNRWGAIEAVQNYFSEHMHFLWWLDPRALSIVAFHVAAEFTAGLAMAGALLEAGSLPVKQVVLALLLGNVLSSPMRALRHQFPYYAGIFKPRMALRLILINQSFRVTSVALVGVGYFLWG